VVAKAFILMETVVGKSRDVVAELEKVQGIKTVNAVTGPYDVIAVVEENSINEIGDLVTEKIHPVPGIYRTVTCLAI